MNLNAWLLKYFIVKVKERAMTKKTFLIKMLVMVLVFGMMIISCGDGSNNKSDTGLYLGIIGFNERITRREINLLNTANKTQYQGFISSLQMDDATGLYYAVDTAINMLQNATLPDDLINVSIVTFTDGLDNVSIAINQNYDSRDQYRDAVSARLKNTKIKNLDISAYSIGIRGGDVVDTAAFSAGLQALASNSSMSHEVTSMTQVNAIFEDIASSLYSESQSQSIRLRIPGGYEDGTRIRFTFDNITDAAASNYYIEGTFRRSGSTRSLQNIDYQGIYSSSGSTVSGSISGVRVSFTFDNVSTIYGSGVVNMDNVKQWEYIQDQSLWQPNVEFGQTGDTETIVERKSAVILLVLDCTTSLNAGGANGFSDMKSAANNFIDVLVSGGNNNSGGGTNNPGGSGTSLSNGVWVDGNLTSALQTDSYLINVTAGVPYRIWVNDAFRGNGTRNGDVSLSIDGYLISGATWYSNDMWNAPVLFTPNSSGIATVKIRPFNASSSNLGTYSIVYSTGTSRP